MYANCRNFHSAQEVLTLCSYCPRCSVRSIEVEELEGSSSIYVQSDGEFLGFLPRKFVVLPGAIEMIQ